MIVVIGSGYAGAATAWALARRGRGSEVTLLEAEDAFATHASGRNAGLVGPLIEDDPILLEATVRGARALDELDIVVRCGSILLCDGEASRGIAARAARWDIPVRRVRTEDLARDIPLLDSAPASWAMSIPGDGKVDPAALAKRFRDEARELGVSFVKSRPVTGLAHRSGRITGVETAAGPMAADKVVIAAGSRAGAIARDIDTQGAPGSPGWNLRAYRRHLFVSAPVTGLDPGGPWVWDLTHDVYFRIDGVRLTLCPCDEEPHASEPPEISPEADRVLQRKLIAAMPAVARIDRRVQHACLRTYAPDRRYLVGFDPRLDGLFWVAGLGGSGATASAMVGSLAAGLLLEEAGGEGEEALRRAFAPDRFLAPGSARPPDHGPIDAAE